MADISVNSEIYETKPGIIYLSQIPANMNVTDIKEYFTSLGEVGHIFLQPVKRPNFKPAQKQQGHKSYRKPYKYEEGWIEFKQKKVAKRIAASLNNMPVGWKKRRNKQHAHTLWNIKYLHKFKWAHLSERLAYERAVREQRVRTEIARAKRETDLFQSNVEQSKALGRRKATPSLTIYNQPRQTAAIEEAMETSSSNKVNIKPESNCNSMILTGTRQSAVVKETIGKNTQSAVVKKKKRKNTITQLKVKKTNVTLLQSVFGELASKKETMQ